MCPNRIIQSKSERSHVPRCANVISFVGRLASWEVVPVQVRFPNLKPVEEAVYTMYNSSMRTSRDGSYKSLQTRHSPRPDMSPMVGPFHMVMQLFALAKLTPSPRPPSTPATHLSSPHPKSLTLLSIPTMLEHHIPHMSPGRRLANNIFHAMQ